jgi:hypothetical protein
MGRYENFVPSSMKLAHSQALSIVRPNMALLHCVSETGQQVPADPRRRLLDHRHRPSGSYLTRRSASASRRALHGLSSLLVYHYTVSIFGDTDRLKENIPCVSSIFHAGSQLTHTFFRSLAVGFFGERSLPRMLTSCIRYRRLSKSSRHFWCNGEYQEYDIVTCWLNEVGQLLCTQDTYAYAIILSSPAAPHRVLVSGKNKLLTGSTVSFHHVIEVHGAHRADSSSSSSLSLVSVKRGMDRVSF